MGRSGSHTALTATSAGSGAAAAGGPSNSNAAASLDELGLVSSCTKALNAVGEMQQQLSEKLVAFSTVIKRDVIARPLEEMIATFNERTQAVLTEGNRLDTLLHDTQKKVVDAFAKYDALFREMENRRHTALSTAAAGGGGGSSSSEKQRDLWIAEIVYCIQVNRLKRVRVEYVTGMAALFQQFKVSYLMQF